VTLINAANAMQHAMELEDRLTTLVEQKEQLRKEKDDMDAEEVCVSNLDGSMP
jgi:uncharacterized protein (DUF3084 family)